MAEHDDDVGLTVGRVAVLELGGTGVGDGDRRAQGEGGQGRGRHEGGKLIGDDADEADAHTADFLDEGSLAAALGAQGSRAGDVGGQDREVRGGQDARLQVGQALVELVVAQGGGIQGHRVERLHGGAVLEDGGDVGRSTHGVSGGDEQRVGVGGAGGGDLAGQRDGAGVLDGCLPGTAVRLSGPGDVAVQVGDAQQVNGGGAGGRGSGRGGRLVGTGGRAERGGTESCQSQRTQDGADLDGPRGVQSHVVPCQAEGWRPGRR